MRRCKFVFTLVALVVLLGFASPFHIASAPQPVKAASPRLVVYEEFTDPL